MRGVLSDPQFVDIARIYITTMSFIGSVEKWMWLCISNSKIDVHRATKRIWGSASRKTDCGGFLSFFFASFFFNRTSVCSFPFVRGESTIVAVPCSSMRIPKLRNKRFNFYPSAIRC